MPIVSKALVAAVANGIAAAQSLGAAGALALNGSLAAAGVATMDTQRRVAITSAGNDSGVTWTITGTAQGGQSRQETIQGANAGAAVSSFDYLTVTSIVASGATAGNVTAGTTSTGSTPWFRPSTHLAPFLLDIECIVSGAATYNVETTDDDFWTPATGAVPVAAPAVQPTGTAGAQGNTQTTLAYPVRGWRVTVTAGTGTVTVKGMQAGICNY